MAETEFEKQSLIEAGLRIGSPPTRDAQDAFESNRARRESKRRKRRRRRRRERAARLERERLAREAAAKEAAEKEAAAAAAAAEAESQSQVRESVADVTTSSGSRIGTTSVTPRRIYQQPVEEAISEQETLSQRELRRQRIKRAREKQTLLRRRLERKQDLGAGRRVLSGAEQELNVQTRQAGSGRRSGTGRRSLITGSTGGIGYYSRFL